MISCVEWVPKGVADPNPKRYEEPSQAELKIMMEQAAAAVDSATPKEEESSLPADLRMDEYSSDEEGEEGAAIGNLLVGKQQEIIMMEEENDNDCEEKDSDGNDGKEQDNDNSNDSDESDDNKDDDLADVPDTREFVPLNVDGFEAIGLTGDAVGFDEEEYEDASDAEDVRISPNDAILVVAKTEEDFASLEVHVYEQDSGNLFVHHDISLPSFPLALAHGDIDCNGNAGNFCAVGTFSPGIEVWNLDILNPLEPVCVLGSDQHNSEDLLRARMLGQAPKKKKQSNQSNNYHTDAVMALSWNKVHRQVICSGSADCTVKLWDITQANTNKANASTFRHHSDKVQSVVWHPTEGTLLATGSYDKTVALVDARSSSQKQNKIPADCEALQWDPFHTHLLTAASEDGTITCFDVRKFEQAPLWSFVANEYGGVSDLSYNLHVPGMMVTCAIDKTVTLWDTYHKNNGTFEPLTTTPHACGTKEMGVGKLYTIGFYPSSPFLLGCGGGGNEVALWDLSREEAIQNRFGDRVTTSKSKNESTQDNEEKQQEKNFEAMMAAGDAAAAAAEKARNKGKKKKKGTKGKQKVHRKGR